MAATALIQAVRRNSRGIGDEREMLKAVCYTKSPPPQKKRRGKKKELNNLLRLFNNTGAHFTVSSADLFHLDLTQSTPHILHKRSRHTNAPHLLILLASPAAEREAGFSLSLIVYGMSRKMKHLLRLLCDSASVKNSVCKNI